jgi:hypothetical protein
LWTTPDGGRGGPRLNGSNPLRYEYEACKQPLS